MYRHGDRPGGACRSARRRWKGNCFSMTIESNESRAMRICVQSYPGIRGEETPCAFHLGGRRLPVIAVLERWSDLHYRYFELSVSDGRRFVLRYDSTARCWELAAVYAGSRPKSAPRAAAIRPAAGRAPLPGVTEALVAETFTASGKEKQV
jgi:hypothetical protein